jgi:hypothetical protein
MPPTDRSVESIPTDIIRTETVLSKLPIHALAKKGQVEIAITQVDAHGTIDLQWDVSYNQRYGPPRQLAYKLDTLVVNRCLDTLERPLPKLIRLGSLREISAALRLTFSGRTQAEIKHALHQNAGAYITAKLRYTGRDGTEQCLETGFTRYHVIFTGQRLPHGLRADAVYLALHDPYWEVLHHAPVRPLDYEYLTTLTPSAQRFYELLSYQMFAALKHRREEASLRYSTYCTFAPQQRYLVYDRVKKQMYKVHQPHLQSGYLAAVRTERVRDDEGEPDWLLRYTPGPKARAEYQAFTRPHRKVKTPLQRTAEAGEPAKALGGDSEVALAEPVQAEVQSDPCMTTPSPCGRDARAESKPGEPAAAACHAFGNGPLTSRSADGYVDPAAALVQQFYREVHGVSNRTPHPKEITHASGLLHRHGSAFASFFLAYAQRAVRREERTVHVFGGIMHYEASALAAYQHHKARAAKAQSEAAADQQRRRLDTYEAWLRQQLEAIKASLAPAELQALRTQAWQHLSRTEKLPGYALERRVAHEVDTQLINIHRLPSFEVWSQQDGTRPEALQ